MTASNCYLEQGKANSHFHAIFYVAGRFGAWGEQSQLSPLPEYMTFKKNRNYVLNFLLLGSII